jgi:M6 family metalloprotease-like protein
VETLVVDNFQTGSSRQRVFLTTSQETLELQGAQDKTAVLTSGQTIAVTGQTSGNGLVVSQMTTPLATSTTGTCSPLGQQDVAIILVSFPSEALLSSVTPQLMSSSFFGAGATVNTFLQESSFGQTAITGDVLGPFVLDGDYFDQPLAARDAALRAASSSANLTKYTGFFIVGPQDEMGMDSGGMALIGCGQITSPQGTLYASSMWLGAESMVTQAAVVATAAHEMGHGFGLEHARFADYGAEPLGPMGQAAAAWDQLHEYGDSFSSMGRNSGQWAAPHKAQLGWLQTGTNIQTVTTAGSFTLSPYEQAGSGQVLRVLRGNSNSTNDWLWLEYRQPQGVFDTTLSSTAFAGAMVHYVDPALTATLSGMDPSTYTNLVNFHPSTYANDPTLHVGETWKDPYGNLSFTVTSATASGLNVSVAYAPASVCPSSVGNAQSFAASGGTGQISVTATSGCSWSATASVPWITPQTTSSATGNGTVSFSVAANPNVTPRWGKITVGGAFVVVTQAGSIGSLTISPQAAEIPASGGTGQFSVTTSSPDYGWSYMPNVPWITSVDCSCFAPVGSATLSYIVAANPGAQRTGTISVNNLVYTVTQDGGGTNADGITWNQLTPQDAPSARMDFAMAPLGTSGQAILYGGNWNATRFNDTWLWNGTNWTQLQPANNPGIDAGHTMVYDAARGQIVLFGGAAGASAADSNQTWIWNGTNWIQMNPAVSPPARDSAAMAYDAVSQKVVLFGGYWAFGIANDTWTWDGSNWTQMNPLNSPSPRVNAGMAFDPMHGNTVLFGGLQPETPLWYADTWIWNGSNWQQIATDNTPPARAGQALAYDPALQSVIMVGGMGGKLITGPYSWYEDFRQDTWAWNGETWIQWFPETQPNPAYTAGAYYDNVRNAFTLHIGDSLTCVARGPKTFTLTGTVTANTPTPGFRLAASATSASVASGASTPLLLTTTAFNQFQSSIALSVNGLPKGVTATFSSASIAAPGSGTSTLTLAAASGTAAGSFTLTVTATGGGVTNTQPVTLTVLPAPSFSLTASATVTTVTSGASATFKLTTAALYGFQSPIALSMTGLPKGVTASFAPATIASPGSGTSTLTLSAASGMALGSFTLNVTATGAGVTKTQSVSLSVIPAPSFSLTPSATSATVYVGASTTIKVTTTALYGFQSQIALSMTGLPKGVTASFAPATIASPGSGTSTLTLSAASGTAASSVNPTMEALGGGMGITQLINLTVLPPPSFSLTPSATSATVSPGASTMIKVATAALYGFQSQVLLSVSGLPKGMTASFAPSSFAAPGSGTTLLTMTAASATAAGSFSLTVTATGGGQTKTQPVNLTVLPPPSFSLTPGATSATVVRGASTTIKLTTAALYGFQSQVLLSVSGLPKGVTASFAPASIAAPGSGTTTLTLGAASATTAGSFNLTVTATGGGVTKTQALTFSVALASK